MTNQAHTPAAAATMLVFETASLLGNVLGHADADTPRLRRIAAAVETRMSRRMSMARYLRRRA